MIALVFAGPGAFAQGLPAFDAGKGFEVQGVLGEETLIVKNGGTRFACWIEQGCEKNACYRVLNRCTPILTAKAAFGVQRAEKALIATLEAMPSEDFVPAIEETLRARGCVLGKTTDMDVFEAELAHQVARLVGYEGVLSDETVSKLADMTDDAGYAMAELGKITRNKEGIITLVDCE